MCGLSDRIKMARKHAGLTQPELSELSGVSVRTLKSYEKDDLNITVVLVQNIARICRVNEIWLLTGNGEMLIPIKETLDTSDEALNSDTDPLNLEDIVLFEIVKKFKQKKLLKECILKMAELEMIAPSAIKEVMGFIEYRLIKEIQDQENEQKKVSESTTWKGEDRRKNRAG